MDERSIGYDIVACALGQLLVAATEKGVCNVRLGDDARSLEEGLRAEFPFAALRRERARLAPWVASLRAALAGRSGQAEVPLDVRPSQFQRRVWEAIAAIPRGEARSYSAIAAAIGRPRAARAVARACASNPVALLIPCHRVVAKGGEPGGYRWGAGRKRTLLALERQRRRRKTCSIEPSVSASKSTSTGSPSASSSGAQSTIAETSLTPSSSSTTTTA
jgi:AraC family transcriptional regulator of adaptative response/methylated-DNA-[protein]-cysteine methyltransferase